MNEIFVYVAPVQWKPRWEIKIHRCGNIFSRSKKEIARHSLSPREKFQRVIFQREIVSSNHQKRKKKRTFEKKIQDTRNFVTINCEGFLEKIMDSDKIYQKAIKFSEMYINILYWFYTDELFNFVEINLFEWKIAQKAILNSGRICLIYSIRNLFGITFCFLIVTRLLKVNAHTFFNYSTFQPFYQATEYKSFISINIQRFSII